MENTMKMLRMILTWPLIFAAVWYFFSFQIAAIVSLAYLHILTILLFQITEKHKEKLVQIVEHIKQKDGLVDPQDIDFSSIMTADDIVNAMSKLNAQSKIKEN
jgi:hypothetical protein